MIKSFLTIFFMVSLVPQAWAEVSWTTLMKSTKPGTEQVCIKELAKSDPAVCYSRPQVFSLNFTSPEIIQGLQPLAQQRLKKFKYLLLSNVRFSVAADQLPLSFLAELHWAVKYVQVGSLKMEGPKGTVLISGDLIEASKDPLRVSAGKIVYSDGGMSEQLDRALVFGEDPGASDYNAQSVLFLNEVVLPRLLKELPALVSGLNSMVTP